VCLALAASPSACPKESPRVAFNPIPVTKRLDALCRARLIDPLIERVGRVLLWNCRAPDKDAAQVSYERLAELAGIGLTKTKKAVARLIALGVIAKQKTRLRIAWGGGIASRQWRNIYRFLAPATEVARRPTDTRQEKQRRCERSPAALVETLRAAAKLPDLLAARRAAWVAQQRALQSL
jgi:hypothetical protein